MDTRAKQDAARGEQLLFAGDVRGALTLFQRAAKRDPRNARLQYDIGMARNRTGDYKGAAHAVQKAIALKPDVPLYHVDLGQIHVTVGEYDRAEHAFDKALSLEPGMPFALGAKIEFLQLIGRLDEARKVAGEALARHPADIRIAIAYAKLAPSINAERQAIDALRRVCDDPTVKKTWAACEAKGWENSSKAFVLFRLAALLDRVGEYDRAFEAAAEANQLLTARFDPTTHAQSIERMIAQWTPDAVKSLPLASKPAEQPLFIVGMMRSGTSLVEQILSCHPDAYAAGELNTISNICARLQTQQRSHEPHLEDPTVLTRPKVDQAQREYLTALYHAGARREKRVTDKMPHNFLHLGLISRTLPGARVIHCTRDPLDIGISCFINQFQGNHPWCQRLDWIGAYHNEYRHLMDHWQRVLAELPILEVPYEQLVAEQEAWTRRIIDFAGLEWDDACLRFHESKRVTATLSNEQVRRPMYSSSVARHKHYEAHLEPLKKALGID